jgi:hypothetical protein
VSEQDNYDIIVQALGTGAARQARVARALSPIIADTLNLDCEKLWFSDMRLVKTPNGSYHFSIHVREDGEG